MEEKNVMDIEIVENELQNKDITMIDILKLVAPGTSLRVALDDLLRAGMGALIAFDKENLSNIVEGGFRVNCKFSAQRLVELAKMDGAIIISSDVKKILYANTLLVPGMGIQTKETGTRHKAAERTSKQIGTITIAVSERKNKTTIYHGQEKYVLESSTEILRRATENLQILEKQKEIFDELLVNFNILEINSLVTTPDVAGLLQRIEIMGKISERIKKAVIELGKDGIIVSMRLRELVRNLEKIKEFVLKDYFGERYKEVSKILDEMSFNFLLESSNITKTLFGELTEKPISPRGYRIIDCTNLLSKNAAELFDNFKDLEEILDAKEEDLISILREKEIVEFFKGELQSLKEKIMSGKKIE